MKILHLIGGELSGGAARGAYWLHKGLLKVGVDSKILTNSNETFGDSTIKSIALTNKEKIINRFRSRIDQIPLIPYSKRQKTIFSTSIYGYNVRKDPLFDWAEIIHLHWINGGFVNIRHISTIRKPIIWTMRDMWPMTGGCHYSMGCERYIERCGKCPELNSNMNLDISRVIWHRKKKLMRKGIKYVAISSWLKECAAKSSLLRESQIAVIPNCINTQKYYPLNRDIVREIMGIRKNEKVILTGAISIDEDKRKGFELFKSALVQLINNNILGKMELFILVFGTNNNGILNDIPLKKKCAGYLHDDLSLLLYYNAADVYVLPTKEEAFGKTFIEAMACGTPCVTFNHGGPKDIIEHKKTGYLSEAFSTDDLARGIEWVLEDEERWQTLSRRAREKVELEYAIGKIARRYVDLYREILENVLFLVEIDCK